MKEKYSFNKEHLNGIKNIFEKETGVSLKVGEKPCQKRKADFFSITKYSVGTVLTAAFVCVVCVGVVYLNKKWNPNSVLGLNTPTPEYTAEPTHGSSVEILIDQKLPEIKSCSIGGDDGEVMTVDFYAQSRSGRPVEIDVKMDVWTTNEVVTEHASERKHMGYAEETISVRDRKDYQISVTNLLFGALFEGISYSITMEIGDMTYSFVFQDGEIKSLRRTMTLDDVCIIVLTKGYDTLKIEDFNGFIGKDVGSGRCIIEFNIRFGEYVLTINAGCPENLQKDTYVGLRRINGDIIDIFYYDIYKFINYGIKELIRPMPTPAQDITPLPSTSPSNTQVLLWDFCLHFSLTSNLGTEIDTEYFNHENPFPYTIPKIEDTDLVEVMPFSAFVFSGFHPDIARELLLAGRTKFKYWNTKKDGTGKIFYPGDIVYLKDFEGPDGLYYYIHCMPFGKKEHRL